MQNARGLRATDRREELKAQTKSVLRKARADADVDQEVLADATGVDPTLLSRFESRRCRDSATLPDLVAWLLDDECRPVARRLLDWIADAAGLTVTERVSLETGADVFRLLGDSLDTSHGVHRALHTSLDPQSPGGEDLTSGELEAVREKLLRQQKCNAKMLHAVDAELTDRAGKVSPLHGKAVGE